MKAKKKFSIKIEPFGFWKRMPQESRRRIEVISGLAVLAFGVFTLISLVTYLSGWKADQSLLGNPGAMDPSVAVGNGGGKLGLRWAYLLVTQWFGLGAFAAAVILFLLAWKLLRSRSRVSFLKVLLLSFTGAFLFSFILSYIAVETGLENEFGGGLGGRMGAMVNAFLCNLIGPVPALCVLGFLLVCWLVFASRRFSERLGSSSTDKEEDEAPAEDSAKTFSWVEKTSGYGDVGEDSAGPEDEPVELEPVEIEEVPAEPVRPAVEEEELEIEEGAELSTDIHEELPRIDVRSELEDYKFPSLDLLKDYESSRQAVTQEELMRNNLKIRRALQTYKIEVENVKAVVGPTVTLYKVYPAPGVKISSIKALQEEIAMALKVKYGVRVVTLEDSVGIEVANDNPSIVPLKAMLNDENFRSSKADLPVAIGFTVQTQAVKVFDLAKAPHLLVAGATKQGKSVGLNVLITSLLYSKHPSELKFVFVDPKMVEFSAYSGLLKHYLAVLPDAASESEEREKAIAKDPRQAEKVLRSLCVEMDERYKLISAALVNEVKLYNEKFVEHKLNPAKGHKYLPYIVVVVDEYADLTMSVGSSPDARSTARSISDSIVRLAQKGRAAGIHVVLATQRPSVDVITGLIKSNFPTRIAFRVFSNTDSRTILDTPGAEKLIGNGDMIYFSGADRERVQCAFISSGEIEGVNKFISSQDRYRQCYSTPYYLPEPPDSQDGDSAEAGGLIDMQKLDPRFEEAARLVFSTQKGSTSDLQRRLGMGFARSGKVMDQLQAAGIVGPQEGSKARQVLVSDLSELESIIETYKKNQQ